jgi:hypothetical protein
MVFFAQACGQFLQEFRRQAGTTRDSRPQRLPPFGRDGASRACFIHINGLVKERAKQESIGLARRQSVIEK